MAAREFFIPAVMTLHLNLKDKRGKEAQNRLIKEHGKMDKKGEGEKTSGKPSFL